MLNNTQFDGLYNRAAFGLPSGAAGNWVGCFDVRYSRHSVDEAHGDRYGVIQLPSSIVIEEENVVEVLVEGGRAVKAIVRLRLDASRDLVLVLNRPEWPGIVFARTVWANRRDDQHRTLNRAIYRRP
jgi:hypothetical protein